MKKSNKSLKLDIDLFLTKSSKSKKVIRSTKIKKSKSNKLTKKKLYTSKLFDINEIISNFYQFNENINTTLIKYRDEDSRKRLRAGIDRIRKCTPYGIDIVNTYFDRINHAYVVKENLLESLGMERAPAIVRAGYEDFTRSLPQYLTQRFASSLPSIKVTNAFMKLWEILTVFPALVPSLKDSNKLRVFHICEAPGQMILALKYFTEKRRKNIRDYEWVANSLNPFSKRNKEEFAGVKIFADDYGLMRENPKKWIWGADGTGNVVRADNIRWYRDYIQKTMPDLDIIVGDGGMSTDAIEARDLQLLDFAQVVMVLACSRNKGSCVVKHFTPYIKRHKGTYEGSGFFIGFIYLYYVAFDRVSLFKPYTSNPDSGEFYVVGEGFRGIGDDDLERLYRMLEKFELNQGLITKDDLPETFLTQMNAFLERMSSLNTMAIEKQNLLLTCYKDGKNPKIQKYLKCDSFLSLDNLQNIQKPRFEEWIRKYGFN